MRPQIDADRTTGDLAMAGIPARAMPLTRIDPKPFRATPPYDGLIVTSRHGIEAMPDDLRASMILARTPVFCIGPSTATAAQRAGFKAIFDASGDHDTLHSLITQHTAQRLLYPSAAQIMHPLIGRPDQVIDRQIAYEAHAVDIGAEEWASLWHPPCPVTAVALYSRRAAQLWYDIARKYTAITPPEALGGLRVYTLSPAIAQACAAWASVAQCRIAAKPTSQGMMDMITQDRGHA
jgi:uroporphyrinogen-III synthase